MCSVLSWWTIQNSQDARARGEFSIVHNRQVGASVGLLKGPQKFSIQFLELHVGFSIVDNTELSERARARGGSSVLPTIGKSARPSASLKGHRNVQISCLE